MGKASKTFSFLFSLGDDKTEEFSISHFCFSFFGSLAPISKKKKIFFSSLGTHQVF